MIVVAPLFAPLTVCGTTLQSRFVLPGMQRAWCKDGAPDHRLAEYYCRRVKGGVGLIISEALAVDHPSSTQVEIYARLNPHTADAWKRTVGAVKDAGGTMF